MVVALSAAHQDNQGISESWGAERLPGLITVTGHQPYNEQHGTNQLYSRSDRKQGKGLTAYLATFDRLRNLVIRLGIATYSIGRVCDGRFASVILKSGEPKRDRLLRVATERIGADLKLITTKGTCVPLIDLIGS